MAETIVSNPQEVPMQEPAFDMQALLDQQAKQFQSQIDELQQQAKEELKRQQRSAKEIITARLADYGLGNMGNFVHSLVFDEGVVDTNIIMGRLREQPQYKLRFAGNEARRKAGMNVLSEGEYIAMENQYRQLMRQSGLPIGFYDNNDDFTNLISNDVSVAELSERIAQGYEAVANADEFVIAEMQRLYGVEEGQLAAYFLDPDKAAPLLIRQARSAFIAGAGAREAGMEITQEQALGLEQAGVSPEQARAGFQAIAGGQELFGALPGQTGEAITAEEQVAGVFGTSAAAQQRIRRRTRERQAEFEAGGGFAAQGSQVTGLT